MFAKTKCLIILNRTGRYIQTHSIRRSNQMKYSSAEGLFSNQVNRTSHNLTVSDSYEADPGNESLVTCQYPERGITAKKAKLEELISKAEDLLECRFRKSRTSPIGVGLLPPNSNHRQHFNLLPTWFDKESTLITSRISSLFNSGHPILKMKQNVDLNAEEHALTVLSNNIQWRALIILLVTKAFDQSRGLQKGNRKINESMEARQRSLSEITEMMHFAFGLHRTVVEINRPTSQSSTDVIMDGQESVMQLGNKIAILFGDLLLSRTSRGLSSLKNAKVTELMSDAISDFSESEILRRRHLDFFNPVRNNSADVFKELAEVGSKEASRMEIPSFESWQMRVSLDIASLIGRSCLCSTLLSQQDEGANKLAFNVGRQIGFVLQAYSDFESFVRSKALGQITVDLSTLPVVLHLSNDSVDRIQKPVDISEVYRDVMTSPKALIQTQDALEHLKEDALRLIAKLPSSSPAPQILEEFIETLS